MTMVCGAAGAASAQTPHLYRVEDLRSLGSDLYAQAINPEGGVAAWRECPTSTLTQFRWTAATADWKTSA